MCGRTSELLRWRPLADLGNTVGCVGLGLVVVCRNSRFQAFSFTDTQKQNSGTMNQTTPPVLSSDCIYAAFKKGRLKWQ